MEDTFDFLIDFQTIADVPLPQISEDIEPSQQETEYYVEIIHNGKKSYQCTDPECGKIYRFKSEANRHLIIHQKERPYVCNFSGCNKTFKRPETLEDHIRIHEGTLPFACDHPECGKRFASKPALRYHKLKHQNNREFRCEIDGCDKSFLTMSQLKQHQKAIGLHCCKSTLDIPENKPYKVKKTEPETSVPETEDAPVTKPSEILWEMKTMIHEEASGEEKIQEMRDVFRSILAENQILKEKLKEKEQMKVVLEKEDDYIFQDVYQYNNPLPHSAESNSLFYSYEQSFLDFLKDRNESEL